MITADAVLGEFTGLVTVAGGGSSVGGGGAGGRYEKENERQGEGRGV